MILIYDIGIFRTDYIIELIAANKIFLVNGSLDNFGNSVQFFIGQMDDTFVKVFAAAVVDEFNITGKNKLYLTLREMRQSSKNLIISRRPAIVLQAYGVFDIKLLLMKNLPSPIKVRYDFSISASWIW